MRTLAVALVALIAGCSQLAAAERPQQLPQEPRPVFKSSVSRVTVAATVRDRSGRPVTNLRSEDFTLIDNGQPRRILEFSYEATPVAVALLADVSGSMDVAHKRAAAQALADRFLKWLTHEDRVSLYAFDRELMEVQPLGPAPGQIVEQLARIDSYGRTSVFDAIAETSKRLAEVSGFRRAVVVLTDGDDNASRLTAPEVSGIASSIDIPVYVVVVVSPLDRDGRKSVTEPRLIDLHEGPLGRLARWTGGDIVAPVAEMDKHLATRQVVSELRHQYLMAFEPGGQAGWHPLEIRLRRDGLTVRARSGYMVPARTGIWN